MSKTQKILIFNDLDGTLFQTDKFIKHIFESVSCEKSKLLREKIQESRKTVGSSVNLPIMNIVGSEIRGINQQGYIFSDVEKYIKNTNDETFVIKHIILTHGEKSLQEFKIKQTFLENLPIEIRSVNDKINFINSRLTKQGKFNYNGFVADYCILVDDKITSFEDGEKSFNTVKSLPNFNGFLISRSDEYNHNINKEIPDFINQVSSLNHVLDYINNMQVD